MKLLDIKYVANTYKEFLIECTNHGNQTGKYEGEMSSNFKHLVKMADDIQKMNDTDKANRWLGFMQGVLWDNNIYTIDELREHNKTGREPLKDEDGNLKQTMIHVAGKVYYCENDCGCNVFHRPNKNELKRYKCNSCGAEYVGDYNATNE